MIRFFKEDTSFELPEKQKVKVWLKSIATQEGKQMGELSYIFCSDEYLLQVNREYLEHDYYTDIITFDNAEEEGVIEGDIFVSIDRVRDNATTLQVPFETELRRVLAHGVLHLCGYKDKTPTDEQLMRAKENFYIGQ